MTIWSKKSQWSVSVPNAMRNFRVLSKWIRILERLTTGKNEIRGMNSRIERFQIGPRFQNFHQSVELGHIFELLVGPNWFSRVRGPIIFILENIWNSDRKNIVRKTFWNYIYNRHFEKYFILIKREIYNFPTNET